MSRCLTREEAADYIGISVETFDVWRRKGILPGPIHGTHRWDRKALDLALDKASGLQSDEKGSSFDEWKNARSAAGNQQGDQAPR